MSHALGDLAARGELEFEEDVADVGFDRALPDDERFGISRLERPRATCLATSRSRAQPTGHTGQSAMHLPQHGLLLTFKSAVPRRLE